MTSLADIARLAIAELRRLPCRVDHDKGPCPKCDVIALWEAHQRIVQTPQVAAEMAKRGQA